jgi:hypothetical protein
MFIFYVLSIRIFSQYIVHSTVYTYYEIQGTQNKTKQNKPNQKQKNKLIER